MKMERICDIEIKKQYNTSPVGDGLCRADPAVLEAENHDSV